MSVLAEAERKRTIDAMNKASSYVDLAARLGIGYQKAHNRVRSLADHGVKIPAHLQIRAGASGRRMERKAVGEQTPNDLLEDRRNKNQIDSLQREKAALVKELEEARKRNTFVDSVEGRLVRPRRMTPSLKGKGKRYRPAIAVVAASDWHVGEMVDPDTVNGLNAYNRQICDKRIERFWEGAAWLTRHMGAKVNDRGLEAVGAIVWAGGDMITGYLHLDQIESNTASPVEEVLIFIDKWNAGLKFYLDETKLDRVTVATNHGNHGRTTDRKRFATGAKNSFEWLANNLLARHNRDSRVKYEIANGEINYVDAFPGQPNPHTIRFHHGDCANYGGGVGGVSVPLLKRISRWDEGRPVEMTVMGHWHQHNVFGRGKLVTNGSLLGYSAYSSGMGLPFEPPMQTFFAVDGERGFAGASPIWCEAGTRGP